jgi:dTMP kinase
MYFLNRFNIVKLNLFIFCQRWELMKDIRSSLDSGVNVIIDRYAFSGVAFSAAKVGYKV